MKWCIYTDDILACEIESKGDNWVAYLSSKPSLNTVVMPYFLRQDIPKPFTTPARPNAAPRRSPYLSLFINRFKSPETRVWPSSWSKHKYLKGYKTVSHLSSLREKVGNFYGKTVETSGNVGNTSSHFKQENEKRNYILGSRCYYLPSLKSLMEIDSQRQLVELPLKECSKHPTTSQQQHVF